MAKPIETLSPTDEAIFRTATLKSLQGAAEDPERIGAEYMPDEQTAEAVILADMTGYSIPSNALGQKGGVLHFGNTPAFDIAQVFNTSVLNNGTAVLASFNIPAALMVDGQVFRVDFDAFFKTSTNGGDPGDVAVCIDFQEDESDDLTKGLVVMLPISPASTGSLKIQSTITALDIGTLTLDIGSLNVFGAFLLKANDGAGFLTPTFKTHDVVTATISGGATLGVAGVLRVRLVSYQGTHANTAGGVITGRCFIRPI
jgi:hypothetical protein